MNTTTFRTIFLEKIINTINKNLIPNANKRFRKYLKGEEIQDKPINSNFQTIVNEVAISVLNEMKIDCWTAITEHRSDTHLETDSFILQLDAKGCLMTDRDFKIYGWYGKNQLGFSGLQVHLGLAQHTRTFTHILDKDRTKLVAQNNPVVGKQLREIDGKPVYTLVSFMRWGYTEQRGYFVDSVGISEFPHENDVYGIAGKQKGKELRFIITNPALYSIHSFASESDPQTQGSTPSDNIEHQVVELPTQ
jgi:hypothetical protein